MIRIRGLELLFNIEKQNLKSKEDCIVAALHCLIINNAQVGCVGIGDEWKSEDTTTELLPAEWNSDQDVYSLRYITKDKQSHILLKFTKVEHMFHVNAVLNEEVVASMSLSVDNYISDDFSDYSKAYKNLEYLSQSFHASVIQNFKPKKENQPLSKDPNPARNTSDPSPLAPSRSDYSSQREDRTYPFQIPRVGGSDLDPFGGSGGMLMDPSSFGIPARPTMPQFGVGGPGGLPRGAVPPGARFDPFMPPIRPDRFGRNTDPDLFGPPGFHDFL